MEKNTMKFKISSDIRLPFEPKGEALKLKNNIRSGINSLEKQEYTVLNATLTTEEKGFFDVENVLFYNVGSGSFRHLEIDELHFRLRRSTINNKYEYSYEIENASKSSFSDKDKIIEFKVQLPKLASDLKPAYYWQLMHKSEVYLSSNYIDIDEFGLLIEIELEKKNLNLTSVIKPMLDGIISTLHYQECPSKATINYLSEKHGLEHSLVMDMFKEKPYSILGNRDLISEYRNGVKWNPADEKCICAVIRQKIAKENRIQVKVYKL